jgi:hypothetical protein
MANWYSFWKLEYRSNRHSIYSLDQAHSSADRQKIELVGSKSVWHGWTLEYEASGDFSAIASVAHGSWL